MVTRFQLQQLIRHIRRAASLVWNRREEVWYSNLLGIQNAKHSFLVRLLPYSLSGPFAGTIILGKPQVEQNVPADWLASSNYIFELPGSPWGIPHGEFHMGGPSWGFPMRDSQGDPLWGSPN